MSEENRVGITCPMCKKYFGVELAPGESLSKIKTVDLYHMVYEDEPAHAICSACGRDVSLKMTYMHGEEHELIAECLEHGRLPAAGNEKPEGIVWLNTTLMGETCGPCVHKGPDSKPVEGAWDKYCNDCKTARSNFKAPSGDGKDDKCPCDSECHMVNHPPCSQRCINHYHKGQGYPYYPSGDGIGGDKVGGPQREKSLLDPNGAVAVSPAPETPEGKKYGCPKSIKKDNEWFCDLDGTRCHTACSWFFGWKTGVGLKSALPKTPESAELIAWCEEHGRETVKKIMFGRFDSKVSGFTLFFKCGARQWYRLPFILDPVFRRPSGDEQSGHGAQGEPAPPNHQTSFLGLETPAPISPEGKKCAHCGKPVKEYDDHFVQNECTMFDMSHWSCDEKPPTAAPKTNTPKSRPCQRLNAIDDSRCGRPEDDNIHDPLTAGSHVYDPLPPDDSIDTCCYICAVHPYAWLECKGTRGDGDCSKCTPCPIFKPRSPAAELGNGTGAQREAATPGLPTSAGHETPTPSVTAGDHEAMWWYGIHIPTLVKIKEVINSDEYLSKNIAAAEGLSLVNEIIDRYIKLPAAATGAAAVTPIVGSAPALAETAGDLKAKLAEMTKFRDNAVSHYNDKCEEVRDLQAKLDAERTESVEALNRVNALEAKLAAEKKDREDAQFEGHRLRAQLAAAERNTLMRVDTITTGADQRIAALEKEKETVKVINTQLLKQQKEMEAKLAAAEKDNKFMHEVDQKRADFTKEQNARIASLEQKYTALEKDYNAAYEKLATAEKREATEHDNWLSADINWKHEAYVRSQLEERCRQYHARISTLEKELAEAKANLKAEEKRYYEEQMKVTDLQARLAAAEARFCKPAECIRIASLEAEVRRLKGDMGTAYHLLDKARYQASDDNISDAMTILWNDNKPSGDGTGGAVAESVGPSVAKGIPPTLAALESHQAPETPEGKKCQHCGKPVKLSDEHFVRMEDTMFDTSHWSCDEKPSTATPKSETLDGCTRCGHRNGEHTQFGHCKKCNCEDYTRSPYYRLASGDGKYPNCHHSPHTGMCRVTPNGGPDVCCCTKGHIDVDAGIADEIGKDLHLAPELSMGPCNDCIVVGGCSLSKYIEGTGMICDKKARLSQPTAAQATPEWKTCRDCVPPYGHCYVPCAKLRAEAEARLAAAEARNEAAHNPCRLQLDSRDAHIADLTAKLAAAERNTLMRVDTITTGADQRIASLEARIDIQAKGHQAKNDRIAALEGAAEERLQRIRLLEAKLAAAETEWTDYLRECGEVHSRDALRIVSLEKELEGEKRVYKLLLEAGDKGSDRIASLEAQKETLHIINEQLLDQQDDLEAKLAAAGQRHPDASYDCPCDRIASLEKQLAAAERNTLMRVDTITTGADQRIASLEEKLAAAEVERCGYMTRQEGCCARQDAIISHNKQTDAEARIATLEVALRQRCNECPHDTDDKLCKHCLWYEYKHPSGDDSEKCYEEDRKTIESLLAQRDKLANEVNRLQTALDGAADLMIGGVEGPVQPPKSDLKPGEGRPIPRGEMMAKRLVDKFKEDFKMNFEQDDHICPDEMLKWLEDNA